MQVVIDIKELGTVTLITELIEKIGDKHPEEIGLAEAFDKVGADGRKHPSPTMRIRRRIFPLLDLPDRDKINHQAKGRRADIDRLHVMIRQAVDAKIPDETGDLGDRF